MLDKAKSLLRPSARSAVPPFLVMDVMAAAARLEAQGRRIVHMEVGQPAPRAPTTAIAAARAALSKVVIGYTETLGIGSLRARIARAYREWLGLEVDPQRIVVTTGSSAGFILAFLAAFEPGDRVAMALPGYPPYRHILNALGCEAVGIETTEQTRWSITGESIGSPPGRDFLRLRQTMSNAIFDVLRKVTTATITTMLLKKGIRRCWMNGPKPLVANGERLIGPAFTLRFVPVREDLATPESWAHPISTRAAIEEMPEGVIAVADAMGVPSAGIFGDILCARMKKRDVAALVTDGVLRDRVGVLTSALPVWCAGVAAPASVNGLTFVGWQQPIGCGGCAVFPGDIIAADDDGAVVIPQNMLEFVAHEGAEHELYESWVFSEVEKGVKLPGLYPPNEDAKARYAAWRKSRA